MIKHAKRVRCSNLSSNVGKTGLNRCRGCDGFHSGSWLKGKLKYSCAALFWRGFPWIVRVYTRRFGCQDDASSFHFNHNRGCPICIKSLHFASKHLLSLVLKVRVYGQNNIAPSLSFLNHSRAGWNLDSINAFFKTFLAVHSREAGIELPFDAC